MGPLSVARTLPDLPDCDASDRDLAVVGLLTLNPVNTSRKLSFPIYFGGGYLVSQGKWFWLLGPGVSVQF